MKQKIFVFLCLLLFFCLCCCLYTSCIGEAADGIQLETAIDVTENFLFLTITPKDPNTRLTALRQDRDGMALYIRVRKVAPPFAPKQIQLQIPRQAQEEIWLGGRLIWESK